MKSRRSFFRNFIGHAGTLIDEARGVEMIPLNRLKELPPEIIEQIEPVFFPGIQFKLEEDTLFIHETSNGRSLNIKLNVNEIKAFNYFNRQVSLKNIAIIIGSSTDQNTEEVFSTVASLFFRLASLRICHPKKIYRIDELVKPDKK